MGSKLRLAAVVLASAITTVGMGVFAPAANAANSGATTATFTISGGTLDITVPSSTVDLTPTAVTAGSLTASGALGNTTVSDQRAALIATWTVTISSTDFMNTTTNGTSANEKVANSKVGYSSGLATGSGTGAFVPGVIPAATGVGTGTAGPTWAGVGVNTQTWNPTMSFVLATSQVAGTYTGTITQSVA